MPPASLPDGGVAGWLSGGAVLGGGVGAVSESPSGRVSAASFRPLGGWATGSGESPLSAVRSRAGLWSSRSFGASPPVSAGAVTRGRGAPVSALLLPLPLVVTMSAAAPPARATEPAVTVAVTARWWRQA